MFTLVSIIMPAYNAEQYIAESIRSVLAQTYVDWELIITDDGSTDRTSELISEFSAADERIKYFHQPNGRLGKARNTAIENAKGDLIAFLDSDDLWLPQKLEFQVKTIAEFEADLVFCDGFIFTGEDIADESMTFPVLYGRHDGMEMFDRLILGNRIPVLSVAIRRSALERAGRFEERELYHGCEDYDLWLRLAKQGAVFYGMKEKLVRYRRHALSMTHCPSNILRPELAVVQKHLGDNRGLAEDKLRRRIRELYRDLIYTLIEEGQLAEAGQKMGEFASWDNGGVAIQTQRVLLWLLRGHFIGMVDLFRRARESFSYRIGRHFQSSASSVEPSTMVGDRK